jgi:hypothetical protein
MGIRTNIKLSRPAYKNFTGKDEEGFLPLHQFDRVYKHFQDNTFNVGAIENAVGIVRRFNNKEMKEFIKQLEEETGYALCNCSKEKRI